LTPIPETDLALSSQPGFGPHWYHQKRVTFPSRVIVYLYREMDLYHLAKTLSGLWEWHERGRLQLELRWEVPDSGVPVSDVVPLEVDPGSATNHRRVVIDLLDRSDVYSEPALRWADVYFKRSYFPPDVERFQHLTGAPILPFGLNHACRTPGFAAFLLSRTRGGPLWNGLGELVARPTRQTYYGLYLRRFWVVPPTAAFEREPQRSDEPRILFQTRLWPDEQCQPDSPAEVNGLRAELVRVLRQKVGPYLVGGLMPTPLARAQYPDLITRESTRQRDYARLLSTCAIGVYSRGLHHSLAFKLGEYLAGSMALVSEPLRNQVAQPLVEGENVHTFKTAEEGAELCEALVKDRDRLYAMRRQNHQYYLQNTRPAALVERALTQVGPRP
jgi:hypothetical protein